MSRSKHHFVSALKSTIFNTEVKVWHSKSCELFLCPCKGTFFNQKKVKGETFGNFHPNALRAWLHKTNQMPSIHHHSGSCNEASPQITADKDWLLWKEHLPAHSATVSAAEVKWQRIGCVIFLIWSDTVAYLAGSTRLPWPSSPPLARKQKQKFNHCVKMML